MPVAPRELMVLTTMRWTGFSRPKAMMTSSSLAWRATECPSPPKWMSSRQRSQPSFQSRHLVPAKDGGELLARERLGGSHPGKARHEDAGRGGNRKPAIFARTWGDLPTLAGLMEPSGRKRVPRRASASAGETKWAPCGCDELGEAAGHGGVHDGRLLGGADDGVVEGLARHEEAGRLGEVGAAVDVAGHVARAHAVGRLAHGMGRAHHGRAARGEYEGDGPVPEELVRALHRKVLHAGDEARGRAGLARRRPPPPGPPRGCISRPIGWGEMTMASRALTAIMLLKRAVEVGLVLGMRAATTPMGRAMRMMCRASSRSTTPTVLVSRIVSQRMVLQSWFLSILCS